MSCYSSCSANFSPVDFNFGIGYNFKRCICNYSARVGILCMGRFILVDFRLASGTPPISNFWSNLLFVDLLGPGFAG